MSRRLPSLLAIRYFEAVGRNLSFTMAAKELNVTQAAVSHQIRKLEEKINIRLLTRKHQGVELTHEGEILLRSSVECLDKLADTFEVISNLSSANNRLVLSVTPLLSANWLLPRLNGFVSNRPNVDVVLHSSLSSPVEDREKFDYKIFYSREEMEDADHELLLVDELLPICNPSLTKGLTSLPLQELSNFSLIHEFDREWWVAWCELAGIDPGLARRGMVVKDPALLEKAALIGSGLILGSSLFMRDKVKSGELITPFGNALSLKVYYYLCQSPTVRGEGANQFRNWVVSEFCRAKRVQKVGGV
ncbi:MULTISPECIES: LysR family transcriptional regulator [Pseudomonas]|uniref:LysR family transcriptional regulator n=1 Tax=Pseudomonas TaxID=286 RepID=UPI00128EB8D4|nr:MULTISPECIES: LysR family transcriptional regulator [Pseudomonas]MBF8745063.1 LysR family transcriptional regulator [Pseudomonas monteilii]MQG91131.1 LysR family transcriptional regulator [Pseudomonas sp. MN1F]